MDSWHSMAAAQVELGDDEVHIWRADLDDPQHDRAVLFSTLTADEVARAERFVFTHHRQLFVVARGLLRTILARYTGVAPSALRFGYTAQGRPFLSIPNWAALDFNLSHSGHLALVALTQRRRVGVDIEEIREAVDYQRIAAEVFSTTERQALSATPDPLRREAFFAGWTRKEAFVKALGGGLGIPLDSFDVTLDPDKSPTLLRAGSHAVGMWTMYAPRVADGYAAAVVVEGQSAQLRLYDSLACRHSLD